MAHYEMADLQSIIINRVEIEPSNQWEEDLEDKKIAVIKNPATKRLFDRLEQHFDKWHTFYSIIKMDDLKRLCKQGNSYAQAIFNNLNENNNTR